MTYHETAEHQDRWPYDEADPHLTGDYFPLALCCYGSRKSQSLVPTTYRRSGLRRRCTCSSGALVLATAVMHTHGRTGATIQPKQYRRCIPHRDSNECHLPRVPSVIEKAEYP
ncbi:MAG: hypothetical protein IPN76_06790 [Saprospiraceae bacterium]|nr:hypothetical protein [Saprospiraceae bacterium]